jgi:ankyrin repeat protein
MNGEPLLEWALWNASPELVQVLLRHGADAHRNTREGQSLLALAVALGRTGVAAALVDHGVDLDAPANVPVSEAFFQLFPTRYAQFYLTKDAGLTPLMLGILAGDQDTVRALLARNPRLDTPTKKYRTWPLGLAANQNDVEMIQILLRRDPEHQPRKIVVSLSEQSATMYVAGKVALRTRVSTGRRGYETPPGEYVVTNKHRRWTSTLYDAPMPYFMRLNGGAIGLHAGVVPRQPASHGCIRVPEDNARRLFAMTEVGDLVTVLR